MSVDISADSKEAEAQRVIEAGRSHEIPLRLVGGIAIKLHCPSATYRALARDYADIDYVGHAKHSMEIRRLFEELGYIGNKRFNAMQGRTRLVFAHPQKNIDVDIFLDVFQMCQKLDLSRRLEIELHTLSLADLLLTKLQVVQLNEKDLKDIYSLLHDHAVGETTAPEIIDVSYIARLCADEWPWYRTALSTIDKARDLAGNYLEGHAHTEVRTKLIQLKERVENVPKTLKWKMRARVGDKVRWYDLPEDTEAIKTATRAET